MTDCDGNQVSCMCHYHWLLRHCSQHHANCSCINCARLEHMRKEKTGEVDAPEKPAVDEKAPEPQDLQKPAELEGWLECNLQYQNMPVLREQARLKEV